MASTPSFGQSLVILLGLNNAAAAQDELVSKVEGDLTAADQFFIDDDSGKLTDDEHAYLKQPNNEATIRHTLTDVNKARMGLIALAWSKAPTWLQITLGVIIVIIVLMVLIPGIVVAIEALEPDDAKYRIVMLAVLLVCVYGTRYLVL
jgi:hypothetical protein